MKVKSGVWVMGAIMVVGVSGCATKDFVNEKFAAADQRAAASQSRLDQHDAQLSKLDRTSREALDRAQAAGKLAEGKFVYTTVLQDDSVKFPVHSAELSAEAQARLLDLVQKLKTENRNVYLEIQGHTDSAEPAKLRLGEARAEAVRRFMYQHGVPLNRMSSISYGDVAPIAPNTSREGRAQNRRVVVVVLA